MLTEIYIEALLVDEDLADQVWDAWDADELNNAAACIAWMLIARSGEFSLDELVNLSSKTRVSFAVCSRGLPCR